MPVHDWTLVEAGIFHHFHHCWIGAIGSVLNKGILPADYYAMAEQIAARKEMDVLTLQRTSPSPGQANGAPVSQRSVPVPPMSGSTPMVVAVAPPRVRLSGRIDEDIHARKQRTIVVRHISDDRVVALVEVLSPGNKGGEYPFRSFVQKMASLLRGGYHLLLIDLHPPGPRDPNGIHRALLEEFIAKPDYELPREKPLTLASYVGGDEKSYFVENVAVNDALPDMPLFLDPEQYVSVPLEATYRTAWEDFPLRWREVLESQPRSRQAESVQVSGERVL